MASSDIPLILTGADIIPIATELPTTIVVAQAISLPEAGLVVVAVLLTGTNRDTFGSDNGGVVSDVAFASFSPSVQFQVQAAGNDQAEHGTEGVSVPVPLVGGNVSRQVAWEQFRAGVEEAFQQEHWLRQGEHLSQDALVVLRRLFEQAQQWWQSEAARRGAAGRGAIRLNAPFFQEVQHAPAELTHDFGAEVAEAMWREPARLDLPELWEGSGQGARLEFNQLALALILLPVLPSLVHEQKEQRDAARTIHHRGTEKSN